MWERSSNLHKERRQRRTRTRERFDSLPNLSVSREYFHMNLNMAGHSPIAGSSSNSAPGRAHSQSANSVPGNLPRDGTGTRFSPSHMYNGPLFQRMSNLTFQYVNRGTETIRGMKVWHMVLMGMVLFAFFDQIGFFAFGSRSVSFPVEPITSSLRNSQTVHIYHFRDNENENETIKTRLTTLGKETKQLVDTETSSIKDQVQLIDDNFGNLLDRVQSMVNMITALKFDLTNAKSEIDSLKSTVEGIYDISNVGSTILQNLESYSEKSKHPWVFPCDWSSCRVQNLSQVFNHLGASRANDRKIVAVQLGACAIDATVSFVEFMRGDVAKYVLVDEWAPGSSAADPTCRAQRKGAGSILGEKRKTQHQWRGELELQTEFETLDKWAKSINDTDVKILRKNSVSSIVLNQFQSKSIDVLFIDHCLESHQKKLGSILKNWIGKLNTGGIVIGHSYGVAKPSSVQFHGIPTHWNKGFDGFVHKTELGATKNVVDAFVMDKNGNAVTTIRVAGDTVWYLQKRKVRLSDLFSDP